MQAGRLRSQLIIIPLLYPRHGEKNIPVMLGVNSQKLVYTFLLCRMKYQAYMLWLFDLIDDLFVGVMRRVWLINVCESERDTGEILSEFWLFVWFFCGCRFELCPFAPEVKAR